MQDPSLSGFEGFKEISGVFSPEERKEQDTSADLSFFAKDLNAYY